MEKIKDFENGVRKYNINNTYRTFTQIAYDPAYYDIICLFDTKLEIDLYTFRRKTMTKLIEYLNEFSIEYLRPDYIPNMSEDIERLGITKEENAKELYNAAKKQFNGKHNGRYMYVEEAKQYKCQIRIEKSKIRTLYDFIKLTKQKMLELSQEYQDAISIVPFQIDNAVSGQISYFVGNEYKYHLIFNFNTASARQSFITACMLNQCVRNQEEFDELRFNEPAIINNVIDVMDE